MNGIWVAIPVKPFDEGKARLAPVLNARERRALNREFLARTLEVALRVFPAERMIVVSRSAEARAIASDLRVHALEENEIGGLNDALLSAAQCAGATGAKGVLSLSTDLPLLEASDLRAIIDAKPVDGVTIARDRRGTGTNALLVRPTGAIPYAYGVDSFAAHRDESGKARTSFHIVERPGLSLDIDTPDDWYAWRQSAAVPISAGETNSS